MATVPYAYSPRRNLANNRPNSCRGGGTTERLGRGDGSSATAATVAAATSVPVVSRHLAYVGIRA